MEGLKSRIVASAVTVTTSATAIPTTAATGRNSISVKNNGSVTIFLGPSTVTSSDGYPLAAGAEFSMDLGEKVVLYGITASGSADTRVLEGI